MFFFISLYLQNVLHYSPIKTGVPYPPLTAAIILSSAAARGVTTRIGFKPTLIAGPLPIAGGLIWFSGVPRPRRPYLAHVLGPSPLAGAGRPASRPSRSPR
jgi:hypothetical protein